MANGPVISKLPHGPVAQAEIIRSARTTADKQYFDEFIFFSQHGRKPSVGCSVYYQDSY
jgi:hypothetical protein